MKIDYTNPVNFKLSAEALKKTISDLSSVLKVDLEKDYIKNDVLIKKKLHLIDDNELTPFDKMYLSGISHEFEKHTSNTLHHLQNHLFEPEQRNQDLKRLIKAVHNYPLDKVNRQIKQVSKKQELDHKTIIRLIKNTKKSLLKIVFKHVATFEELILEQLYGEELETLQLEYTIQNKSFQILNPSKYKSYLELINNSIIAFYTDFSIYGELKNPYFKIIEKFFDTLLLKTESLATKHLLEFEKIQKESTKSLFSFPTHIFANLEAYQYFKESEDKASTAEDIGFLFRVFSEKATTPLIIAKETAFRNWYNAKTSSKIKLNKAIKTFDRIGGKNNKAHMIPESCSLNALPTSRLKTTNQ